MSGPVDVLAAMDAVESWAREVSDQHIDGEDGLRQAYVQDFRDFRTARAAVAELIERDAQCSREIEALRYERNHARASKEHCIKILSDIHALLYPAPVTNAEGMTFVFHSPHVHEQMQALSDRIRAIPDEIAAAGSAS
jgi:hypothetical protein